MPNTVTEILRTSYGWPLDCAPAPKATALALETQTPDEVAATLDAWCWAQANNGVIPWGTEPGSFAAYRGIRYRNFATNMKFWALQTSIALGLQHEIPEDRLPAARTLTEWRALLAMSRGATGYRIDDPASEAWRRRVALSQNPPDEWTDARCERIWELAVLHGSIETDLAIFQTERHVDPTLAHARVLDGTKFLENVLALAAGSPSLPWPPPPEGEPR